MKPSIALAALVMFLGLAAPVVAGPYEDGVAAYHRGDYATALRLLRPLAEHGSVPRFGCGVPCKAQTYLGVMYAKSQGVVQDDAQAYKWFDLAASRYPATGKEAYNKWRGRKPIPARVISHLLRGIQ